MVDIKKLNKNWEELKKVEDKLGKKIDRLVNSHFRLAFDREDNKKNSEEIREVFWKLQEKIIEVEKLGLLNEKNDTKKVYEQGFRNGIGFCNDTLGKFGDWIDEHIENGNLPRSFDWDKAVEKEIKRDIKAIK